MLSPAVIEIDRASWASAFTPLTQAGTARVATLNPAEIAEFDSASPAVRQLLESGLRLTQKNLTYTYGSADPLAGGMDCSGAVYYLLGHAGLVEVPRDAAGMYEWVWKSGHFHAVISTNPKTFELAELKPGDLLFWAGTYHIDRDPPITHVMIYLGTSKVTGRRVMVGSSNGRTYNGIPQNGVSVFDFKLPGANGSRVSNEGGSRFVGYGPVPGLEAAAPITP
jgi:cell wall-associated NlpC family hydrolase